MSVIKASWLKAVEIILEAIIAAFAALGLSSCARMF